MTFRAEVLLSFDKVLRTFAANRALCAICSAIMRRFYLIPPELTLVLEVVQIRKLVLDSEGAVVTVWIVLVGRMDRLFAGMEPGLERRCKRQYPQPEWSLEER